MLKELRLTDIVLVESATLPFQNGFNVISGESGAGKSAIMNALHLIAGERCDLSTLRRGADKGAVEAIFEIDQLPALHHLLEESGISHEPGNELFIRRELSASGKSRAFINNQLAQLTLLKQVSHFLFEVVGQHANQKLLSLDYHRKAIDLYGSLQAKLKAFSACWQEETTTRIILEGILNSEAQRMRDIEVCRMELEELLEANVKEGEEEELFTEYTQLSNADELSQKAGGIIRLLSSEKTGVLALMSKQKSLFDQLIQLSPSLTPTAESFTNAFIELQEVSHTLANFESRIEHNPERAARLSERLELYSRLKRKFGPAVSDIQQYLITTQDKLAKLENADIEIESLQKKLTELSAQSNNLAAALTAERKRIAESLQKAVTMQLRELNMPKVEFFVDISVQKRTVTGDDKVEFFIVPNVGEHKISLRECASGGELSRTMLAMQAVLGGKEMIPTLVFDEIDANIGGETAAIVGEKMQEISSRHQVLCITHFHQVAKQAHHHLRIYKQELNARTVTSIEILNEQTRQQELVRMLGGVTF